jgi:hypothetical protein
VLREVCTIVELNGSTDYVDVTGIITAGTVISFEANSNFSAFRLAE